MNNLNLSDYAYEKFLEFLKNKNLQTAINDMIVWTEASMDDVVDTYLTMFLSTVEINKLDKNDLDNLKMAIMEIRSVAPEYPINPHAIPILTDEFIKENVLHKLKKHGGEDKFWTLENKPVESNNNPMFNRFKKMAGVK